MRTEHFWRPNTTWTERNHIAFYNKAKGKTVISRNSSVKDGWVAVYEIGYGWVIYYGNTKPSLVEVPA